MKTIYFQRTESSWRRAFTLVELLVVIAIIGLLAGLIVYLLPGVKEKQVRSRAKAELRLYETAINNYKTKLGFYPPSNPDTHTNNPPSLFYELTGTGRFIDPAGQIIFTDKFGNQVLTNTIGAAFGQAGFLNSGSEKHDFLSGLKIGASKTSSRSAGLHYLLAPYKGPGGDIGHWHYDSSNPTHNPDSFDLWVEVELGAKTIIIGNWTD